MITTPSFSVTQRIKKSMGLRYNPTSTILNFENDNIQIDTKRLNMQFVGSATDYLVRLCCGDNIEDAFKVPLMGAKIVGESSKASYLLSYISTDLTSKSIEAAYKLCGYDVAARSLTIAFKTVDNITPDKYTIVAIRTLVGRTVNFIRKNSQTFKSGVTFPGGYSYLVNKGDCDYLTDNALWDLKISKNNPATGSNFMEVLAYYVLGMRSEHSDEFKKISMIGIISPIEQRAYYIETSKIDIDTLVWVTKEFLGLAANKDNWLTVNRMSKEVLGRYATATRFNFTDFTPDDYDDGKYKIMIDDYLTYYYNIAVESSIKGEWNKPQSLEKYTKRLWFLKHNSFIMFISESNKGELYILRGGIRKKLTHNLQYYYDNMDNYAKHILRLFGNYWSMLNNLSDALKSIKSNLNDVMLPLYAFAGSNKNHLLKTYVTREKLGLIPVSLSGRIHGCIIDLDDINHLFINPIDGSVHGYNASSMKDRDIYRSLAELFKYNLPGFYRDFRDKLRKGEIPLIIKEDEILISNDKSKLISYNKKTSTQSNLLPITRDLLKYENNNTVNVVHVTETDSYAKLSNPIRRLQRIYDYNLIQEWYEIVLKPSYNDNKEKEILLNKIIEDSNKE